MARRFRRTADGVEARLEPVEMRLLADLVDDVLALLAGDPTAGDPALARLFPDGYRDDPEAAAELRSLTQVDLQEGKRAALRVMRERLAGRVGGRISLDEDAAQLWLGAINDIRLALGTRLDVTDDTFDELEAGDLDLDGDEQQALEVYGWLGWLQETLVGALMDEPISDRRSDGS